MNELDKDYYSWIAAEKAWDTELRRQFGKKANTLRYTTRATGAAGSNLRNLYEDFIRRRAAVPADLRRNW